MIRYIAETTALVRWIKAAQESPDSTVIWGQLAW